ncbi:MAG: transglycosylase SLT domain-containing protein [Nitrospirae bacterium]|nr:transglycosylase SLT domain-containing protein [Nitrospirota bacterium]
MNKDSGDVSSVKQEVKSQKADNQALAATDLSLDKVAAAHKAPETSDNASGHPAIDKTDKQDAGDKQGAAVQSEDNQDKNTASPLGISYKSNATAVKAIDKNISLFKDRIKERFSIWLERSAKYIEIMKDVLKEKKMPEELVFLPIVESGFNLNAYSRARAVGPWQFIAATAKRYGLVIDWWRDERKDPIKSTNAAADYLKDLYGMFGSWKLALAAYNAGEGRIMKALKKTGAEDYWSLLHTKQIRPETKEYVPRYIAATMIANTPEEYGFYNLVYHEPLEYDEVTLDSPADIEVIAKCAESTVEEIKGLNPELRRWSTPPNVPNYAVRLPAGTRDSFVANLESIPVEERFSVDIYTAKKGDTIKKIASKAGVPLGAIIAMNSLSGIERLEQGEKIKIPPKGKYHDDMDDKMSARKASFKKKVPAKKSNKNNRNTSKKGVKAKNKDKIKKA